MPSDRIIMLLEAVGGRWLVPAMTKGMQAPAMKNKTPASSIILFRRGWFPLPSRLVRDLDGNRRCIKTQMTGVSTIAAMMPTKTELALPIEAFTLAGHKGNQQRMAVFKIGR
jgi:hypothetical protein